jgi:hypothetical protein
MQKRRSAMGKCPKERPNRMPISTYSEVYGETALRRLTRGEVLLVDRRDEVHGSARGWDVIVRQKSFQ